MGQLIMKVQKNNSPRGDNVVLNVRKPIDRSATDRQCSCEILHFVFRSVHVNFTRSSSSSSNLVNSTRSGSSEVHHPAP